MREDPDIQAELAASGSAAVVAPTGSTEELVALNIRSGAHHPDGASARLVAEAGGRDGILKFTQIFYQKSFDDPHIDRFIRSHDDPHGDRFASWICEKMGAGSPWTDERRVRQRCPFHAGHGVTLEVHDRSSAHAAAWHSPKRESDKWGEHFKLDDCRIWMRLHFWAAREAGLFDRVPRFMEYYQRMLGHYIAVYERTAVSFVRESARWSADPANTARYLNNNAYPGKMPNIVRVRLNEALQGLPAAERGNPGRGNTGSRTWPYDL